MSLLEPMPLAISMAAAFIIGFSKTGVPGTGILAVPLLAGVFGGRLSVGTMLPLLILADIVAVREYRHDARWDLLRALMPYIIAGFLAGVVALAVIRGGQVNTDPFNQVIGAIVLIMLGVSLTFRSFGLKMVPTSPIGVSIVGILGGFTTMVSNAAGPIMQIYLVANKMDKRAMIGTGAIYFFAVNLGKIPFYLWLSWAFPREPLWTIQSLSAIAPTVPLLLFGAWLGPKALPKIPQRLFQNIVLALSAAGALRLVFSTI